MGWNFNKGAYIGPMFNLFSEIFTLKTYFFLEILFKNFYFTARFRDFKDFD